MTTRLLAIFPHPDDESYGPAGALARADHAAVYCLTRGEASSMGPQRGLSKDEVAKLRTERMWQVSDILELDHMTLGEFPDGKLARYDLAQLSETIRDVIRDFEPQVVIGHDSRGVNAHPDHIATHWATRYALLELGKIRFAMMAYPPEVVEQAKPRLMFATPVDEIDAVLHLSEEEADKKERCLRVHEALITLKEGSGDGDLIVRPAIERYDFFGEDKTPPVDDLFG